MTYPLLAALFFLSVALALGFVVFHVVRALSSSSRPRVFWSMHRRKIVGGYGLWFAGYALFVFLGTGPDDLATYPASASSPYKLPWRAGVTRLVAQGNRSITSHRGSHLHAWDFWMAEGTEVLAARGGVVVEREDRFDGIGLSSNFVAIQHDDGTRALYAHLRRGGVVVQVGESVQRGQVLGASGMVGQTIYPHLHFVVQNREGSASVPISFADVPGGVPIAGRSYASRNTGP